MYYITNGSVSLLTDDVEEALRKYKEWTKLSVERTVVLTRVLRITQTTQTREEKVYECY